MRWRLAVLVDVRDDNRVDAATNGEDRTASGPVVLVPGRRLALPAARAGGAAAAFEEPDDLCRRPLGS